MPIKSYTTNNDPPNHRSLSNLTPYCRLLCTCARSWSIVWWYWVLYLLTILINSTSYQQISKPRPSIVEAMAKARGLQGQGQGHKILSSSCPRGRPSRPVLEDPIPAINHEISRSNSFGFITVTQKLLVSCSYSFQSLTIIMLHGWILIFLICYELLICSFHCSVKNAVFSY